MDEVTYASPHEAMRRVPLSASALTSFILGLVLCVPLLTSILAIIFAFRGFRATRRQANSGRGFAITGLILGISGILLWFGIGAFVYYIIASSAAPRAALRTFTTDLTADNIPAATANCDPSITPAALAKVYAYIAPLGTFRDITCSTVFLSRTPAGARCALAGAAHFAGSDRTFNAVMIKTGGTWKVLMFHIY